MSATVYTTPTQSLVDLGALLPGDLSASRRTPWVFIGRGTDLLSLDITTPATGSPTGAYTLECANDDTRATGEVHPATTSAAALGNNPAGGAAHTFIDKMNTAGACVALVWTWASGGSGCVSRAFLGLKGA